MKNNSEEKNIYLGNQPLNTSNQSITGEEVEINGERYFKISNTDQMRPFFMSIVSHSDHWMFISSTGGLSAGRINSDHALFPYYTDDKITEAHEHTGSKTILLVEQEEKTFLWEPFSSNYQRVYKVERNIYKNTYGNKVLFEEINLDLGITFSYEWLSSEKFGFVRNSRIKNSNSLNKSIQLLDGIQNLLPYGVPEGLQSGSSNLVDAYKKCELEADTIGIYALSAIISDKAEPSEALKANLVFSLGLKNKAVLLSSKQLDLFRKGHGVKQETDIKAERGAYFINTSFELVSGTQKEWMIVADISKTVSEIIELRKKLNSPEALIKSVIEDIELGSDRLVSLVGASDGLQLTADKRRNTRHFANTMFNVMRGGIFDENYTIEKADFIRYIKQANSEVYNEKIALLNNLPEQFDLFAIKTLSKQDNHRDFQRLCNEYLPLKFSRRHGDPSRPWNKFSINLRNEDDGSKILDYQGNWRDIFQNWEALAHSYPSFIEGMMFKFLNASSFDGYNPYRVFKDGFEWETIEPDNPWSYIGYWGDHQIIYLLKFLEFIQQYYPEKFDEYFKEDSFVYANIPYRIKPFEALIEDPKNTIDYDYKRESAIEKRREQIGADGALLTNPEGSVYQVNFIEKILATVLAKISNYIPEGGIWMNTQRPEWNDANNALVGNGVSMVTLYYLRRFLAFFKELINQSAVSEVQISAELKKCFDQIHETLESSAHLLKGSISDQQRMQVLSGLGVAASEYRQTIYDQAFSGKKTTFKTGEFLTFIEIALKHLEYSIESNQREDQLYHAYNLMTVTEDKGVAISYLPEMLEGQVAVLSSGYLDTEASLAVLDALKASKLFREDQYSYVLYPNKTLPRFLEKNNISPVEVSESELLSKLVLEGNRDIILKDCEGGYHFNGNFKNVRFLRDALNNLPDHYQSLVEKEQPKIEAIYEQIFNHKAFTGRSGTFFGYEGLGSIYWHMVSKLRLAAFEVTKKAVDESASQITIGQLFDHYFEINAGIGVHKSPELYGAFPTDPYSHTPGGKGAQQPGMTGQVKEDILCRFGELGVRVSNGVLSFDPTLLPESEFLKNTQVFEYYDIHQSLQKIELTEGSLAYTICQVPVIYRKDGYNIITIIFNDLSTETIEGNSLNKEYSDAIFNRSGNIKQLIVTI
jgi:hypothetical protein